MTVGLNFAYQFELAGYECALNELRSKHRLHTEQNALKKCLFLLDHSTKGLLQNV